MPSFRRRTRRNSFGACSCSSAVEKEKKSVFAPSSSSNMAVAGSVPAMTASSTSSSGVDRGESFPAGTYRRMVRRDRVGGHPGGVRAGLHPHTGLCLRADVADDGVEDGVGILARHEAAGEVGDGAVRDDRVLAAGAHAVDLEGRAGPEPLEGRVARLAVQLGHAEVGLIGVVVPGDGSDLVSLVGAERGDAVVETLNGDGAVGGVQAREDAGEGGRRVGDGAAVAARVEVVIGATYLDVQADKALAGDGERRLARAPHGPVGRDDEVGGQLGGMRLNPGSRGWGCRSPLRPRRGT